MSDAGDTLAQARWDQRGLATRQGACACPTNLAGPHTPTLFPPPHPPAQVLMDGKQPAAAGGAAAAGRPGPARRRRPGVFRAVGTSGLPAGQQQAGMADPLALVLLSTCLPLPHLPSRTTSAACLLRHRWAGEDRARRAAAVAAAARGLRRARQLRRTPGPLAARPTSCPRAEASRVLLLRARQEPMLCHSCMFGGLRRWPSLGTRHPAV